MKKIIYKKLIAIFLIGLLINLISYSSIAYGAGLKIRSATGLDGIDKVLRINDTIRIEVEASIDNKEVLPGQLRFIGPETIATGDLFNVCEVKDEMSNIFYCYYESPNLDLIGYPGTLMTTVVLYHDTGMPGPSEDAIFSIDDEAPIASVKMPEKIGGQKDIAISYSVKDPKTKAGCSGIGKIEFFINDNNTLYDTINLNDKRCDVNGVLTKPASDFVGLEGKFKILIKATDLLGFESKLGSFDFIVDMAAPQISPESFMVLKNNIATTFVSQSGLSGAAVSIVFIGDDLDTNSVIADLSGLNKNKGYPNMKGSCGNSANSLTTCTWSNIDIKIDQQAGNISFTASDKTGNSGTYSLTPSLTVDNDIPEVTGSSTGLTGKDGILLLGSNGIITLNINEVTSGLDASQVLLDLSQLGLGNNVKADECSQGWTCTWKNIKAASHGIKLITVSSKSTDKAGNSFKQTPPIRLFVDSKSPIMQGISITAVGGALPAYSGYIKTFDSLIIEMNLTEDNLIQSAKADMSKFISGNSTIEGACQETKQSLYSCVWQTPPIDIQGYIKNKIIFKITDSTGNELNFNKDIEVLQLANATTEYFSSTVTCSPRLIDRQTTQFLNQRIYCHVQLEGSNAIPIKTELAGCSGQEITVMGDNTSEQVDSSSFFQNIALFNNDIESKDLYLKLTLQAAAIKTDSLPLTCSFAILVKSGNKIMQSPEIENVSLNIEFYNMPLGELSKEVRDKIDAESDIANNKFWKVIGFLNKIFSYAEKICNFYYALNGIYTAFTRIGMLLSAISNALSGTPYGPILDESRKIQQLGTSYFGNDVKTIFKQFTQFCKFISCRLYFDEKWSGKEDTVDASKNPKRMSIGQSQRKNLAFFGGLGGSQILRGGSAVRDSEGKAQQMPGELDPMNFMNPKESLILSIAMYCIPGVIYNLNKLRNIHCMYVDCMNMSAQSNLPIAACEEQKSYATCKYVYGEFFKIIGAVAVFDYLVNLVKGALSDPLALFDVATQFFCNSIISQEQMGIPAALCLIKDTISLAGDVVADIEGVIDKGKDWSVPKDYCDKG